MRMRLFVLFVVCVCFASALSRHDAIKRRRRDFLHEEGKTCTKDSDCVGWPVVADTKPLMMCCAKENGSGSGCYNAAYSVYKKGNLIGSGKDKITMEELKVLARFGCPTDLKRTGDNKQSLTAVVNVERLHGKLDPIVAGASAGMKGEPFYWTIGAVVCDKKVSTARYAITNKHNALDGQGAPLNDLTVMQPAQHPGDAMEDSREVGTVVFMNADSDLIRGSEWMPHDFAIIKFKEGIKAEALVSTKGGNKDVLGSKSIWDILAMPPNSRPKLYILGRSTGWAEIKLEPDSTSAFPGMAMPVGETVGYPNDSDNPNTAYPGNSGSVVWVKDGEGYQAVGLFSGSSPLQDIGDALKIADKKLGTELFVCGGPYVQQGDQISKMAGVVAQIKQLGPDIQKKLKPVKI